MWAVKAALQNALLPMDVYTDHIGIVRGLRRGKDWCVSAGRAHADVWKEVWRLVEDHGCKAAVSCKDGESPDRLVYLDMSLRVLHQAAHVTRQREAAMCAADRARVQGNRLADEFAKLGAELDTRLGQAESMQMAEDKSVCAVSYCADVTLRVGRWSDVESRLLSREHRVRN